MEKHARSTFGLETHAKFVVSIFQGGYFCDINGKKRSFFCGLNPIFLKKDWPMPCNFRCFRSPGGWFVIKNKSHSFALVVPSETSEFCCGFNSQFLWKNVLINIYFVVPVFRGTISFCTVHTLGGINSVFCPFWLPLFLWLNCAYIFPQIAPIIQRPLLTFVPYCLVCFLNY